MPKSERKGRGGAAVEEAPVRKMETVRRSVNGNGNEPEGGVENLDKVRDILFGSQMRDADRRFGKIEERFSKETGDLRDDTRKRLESLEAFARKEIQSVLERIKNEQAQR